MNEAFCARNEAAVHRLFEALSGKNPDFDTVGSLFADNASYWALTPVSPQRHGPQAIVDDMKKQLAIGGDIESGPPHALVSSGNHVVIERTDYFTLNATGQRGEVRICAVLEFDDAGKITAWREYWDQNYCAQQMGVTAAQVQEAII
jgi:limonene-1,2-epoxide hydrolase